MNPTDTFTDSLDRTWSVGRALTRTAWCRSWLAEGDGGRRATLVVPLGAAELGGSSDLAAACHRAVGEVADRLRRKVPGDPELLATAEVGGEGEGARPALLLPHGPTVQQRLDSGGTLVGVIDIVVRAAKLLTDAGKAHGAIHPAEISLGEAGQLTLGLPRPPSLAPHLARLEELAGRSGWRPPESTGAPTALDDTWSLCCLLWVAASAPPPNGDVSRPRPERVPVGPDKVALSTLRDRAMARLAHEQTNPRFRARVAERLAALLNRGLSAEPEPSPPYRFQSPAELSERAQEVAALVAPKVTDVGRTILGSDAAGRSTVQGGEPVTVAVSVSCSAPMADHDDLVAGLRLRDLDAPGDGRVPLEEAKFAVKTHPSGRLRFEFTLPDLAPGRYQVNCAFAVKDSGHEPKVAEGDFEVRPPPGYVPPAEEPGAMPIALTPFQQQAASPGFGAAVDDDDEEDDEDAVTVQMSGSELQRFLADDADDVAPSGSPSVGFETADPFSEPLSEPGAEVIEGVFPRPIAPPSEPLPSPRPVATPTLRAEVTLDEPPAPDASVTRFPGAHVPTNPVPVPPPAGGPPPPLAAVPTPPPTSPSDIGLPTAGDATVPRAPVAMAPPAVPGPAAPAPPPSAHDTTGFPDAGAGTEAPSLGSAWMAASADDASWDQGPEGGDLIADGGVDLPTYEEPKGASVVDKVREALSRDMYTSVVAASAACLLLVLISALVVRAC